MKRFLLGFLASVFLLPLTLSADTDTFFSPYSDPLAPRDGDGLLHQAPEVTPVDSAPRAPFRFCYYFASGVALSSDPAYVGSLEDALRRQGYYCGPTDGVFSPLVRDAIARMQKNYSLRITGTLTLAVRRALHLP
jgi:hypothetical protein